MPPRGNVAAKAKKYAEDAGDGRDCTRARERERETDAGTREVAAARRSQDYRTSGLADYLNANTMLYRGALFPSRLFYNSICDPGAPPTRAARPGRRWERSLARSFVHCNIVKSPSFHHDYLLPLSRLSFSLPSSLNPRKSLSRILLSIRLLRLALENTTPAFSLSLSVIVRGSFGFFA